MNRTTYYRAHSATRRAARDLALRDATRRSATRTFDHEGRFALIFATRSTACGVRNTDGGPAQIVIAHAADRPLRARAADELAHVAECRRSAACWRLHPAVRALRLDEARRTIEIVRDLHSAFNSLPA